jgi:hypothetical protein
MVTLIQTDGSQNIFKYTSVKDIYSADKTVFHILKIKEQHEDQSVAIHDINIRLTTTLYSVFQGLGMWTIVG